MWIAGFAIGRVVVVPGGDVCGGVRVDGDVPTSLVVHGELALQLLTDVLHLVLLLVVVVFGQKSRWCVRRSQVWGLVFS